ncbi:hypothetical protein [Lactococcus protaetiae]|uniref:Uncharacterized protein n=1 Tax=Lactococcus protaetiae TaxID=2592653 RepID=A0A514Z6A3_9LACT|nr:hypothetical protein [Lactococcus protaetiae]QDK70125.1 hypothetical protein FLP15_01705 [Lactococcus protaetiae]
MFFIIPRCEYDLQEMMKNAIWLFVLQHIASQDHWQAATPNDNPMDSVVLKARRYILKGVGRIMFIGNLWSVQLRFSDVKKKI